MSDEDDTFTCHVCGENTDRGCEFCQRCADCGGCEDNDIEWED